MNRRNKEADCDGGIEEGLHDGEGVKYDEHRLAITRSIEEVNEPLSCMEEAHDPWIYDGQGKNDKRHGQGIL